MTHVRVGYNLLWLLPEQAGGAETYAIRVLRALREEAHQELDVTVLCNRRFGLAHPDLAAGLATAVAPLDGRSRPLRVAAESSWLVFEARRRRLDVVHHVNDVVPWVRDRPSVVTIHDLHALERPETFGPVHGAYLRMRVRASARAAAVVTTPSAYVRRRVIDLLGADPDRVLVVGAPLFPIAPRPEEPAAEEIGRPFFVYPAITRPHKNHVTLLRAFAGVATDHPDAILVLTGAPGPAEGEIDAEIRRLGLGECVRRLGRIPQERLDRLLREAAALVYPSRFEGFGLPLVEAMALGCPVIASDATALPEVLGDAGTLVDPDDVEGWASAMRSFLEDRDVREAAIVAGRTRVAGLTPAETAARMVEAYRRAIDGQLS